MLPNLIRRPSRAVLALCVGELSCCSNGFADVDERPANPAAQKILCLSAIGRFSPARVLPGESTKIGDWLVERSGLEPPVSREVLPRENRREHWEKFRVRGRVNRPENEFAFSSVRCRR